MILQSSHVIVDCLICGRPLEIHSPLVSHEIACGHCRGVFAVHETNDGSLTSANFRETELQSRVEQLLRTEVNTNLPDSGSCFQQRLALVSVKDDKPCREDSLNTLPKEFKRDGNSQLTVLLVEHRDEVFARLATDIAEFGIRVIRAKSATEALKQCDAYDLTLLVGNVDLPDQSGWLMTAKLRLFDRKICVWLYQRQSSYYGLEIEKFLDLDAMLAYQGDLLSLSEAIVDLMDHLRKSDGEVDDSDRPEESTAA